ncbi:hypothetical protein K488DRAFT_74889 [Vararia minispora EC-137]|uniref:Uncharacterized protein n=1 Tax=Vararia minispora EC-137 TaxID=1314806 RepID=A0ACB8Q5G1_9AGAM|nr:hypothetical protein K488DRAFT_74889 [Vararia minispora EC-137]
MFFDVLGPRVLAFLMDDTVRRQWQLFGRINGRRFCASPSSPASTPVNLGSPDTTDSEMSTPQNSANIRFEDVTFPAGITTQVYPSDIGARRFVVLSGYEIGAMDKMDALCSTANLPAAVVYEFRSHSDALVFYRQAESTGNAHLIGRGSAYERAVFSSWVRKNLNRLNNDVLGRALRGEGAIDISPSPSPPSSPSARRSPLSTPTSRETSSYNVSGPSSPGPRRTFQRRAAPQTPLSSPGSCPVPSRDKTSAPNPPRTPTSSQGVRSNALTPTRNSAHASPSVRRGPMGLVVPADWEPTVFTPPFGTDQSWRPAQMPLSADGRVPLGMKGIHKWIECKASNGGDNRSFYSKGHDIYEDALADWWKRWNVGKGSGGVIFRAPQSTM